MEAVGIGDPHFTSPTTKGVTGGLSAYIDDHDSFVADLIIDQPLRYAKKHSINDIFMYGDYFENHRGSTEAYLALMRVLRQPFHFHLILGNHDLHGDDPSLGHALQLIQEMKLPNVSIYTKPTRVGFGKARVNFLPYPHSEFGPGLNVAHIDVDGAVMDSGVKVKGPKSTEMAVIGHIHTRQRVRNSFYSGTLYQKNFGESQDKFFHHIVFDGSWEVHDVPVKPVYKLHTVEVATKRDLKGVPASPRDLVKLILLDGCNATAADYAHLNVVKTRAVASDRDLALARVEDLVGEEVSFSITEHFDAWLEAQSESDELKTRASELRRQLLEGV